MEIWDEIPTLSLWKTLLGAFLGRLQLIGRGRRSSVYRLTDIDNCNSRILKVLDVSESVADASKWHLYLGEILKKVNSLKNPLELKLDDTKLFTTNKFIIMNEADNSLNSLLDSQEHLVLEEVLNMVKNILESLNEAKDLNLIHLNIKPSNILKLSSGKFVLTDWDPENMMENYTIFTPPEVYSQKLNKTAFKSDVYSVGIIMIYCLGLQNKLPKTLERFKNDEEIKILTKTLKLDEDVSNLILKMTRFNEEERSSIEESLLLLDKIKYVRYFFFEITHEII